MLMVGLLAISVAGCKYAEDAPLSNTNEAVSFSPAISGTSSVNKTATRTGNITTDNVTADRTTEIALAHAGLTKLEVTLLKQNLTLMIVDKNIVNPYYPIFQSFASIPFFLNIFLMGL